METRIESGIETAMITRAAPASQEDQNHDAGQAGGDDGFADHAVDGGANEDRLIRDRLDLDRRRQRLLDIRQRGAERS